MGPGSEEEHPVDRALRETGLELDEDIVLELKDMTPGSDGPLTDEQLFQKYDLQASSLFPMEDTMRLIGPDDTDSEEFSDDDIPERCTDARDELLATLESSEEEYDESDESEDDGGWELFDDADDGGVYAPPAPYEAEADDWDAESSDDSDEETASESEVEWLEQEHRAEFATMLCGSARSAAPRAAAAGEAALSCSPDTAGVGHSAAHGSSGVHAGRRTTGRRLRIRSTRETTSRPSSSDTSKPSATLPWSVSRYASRLLLGSRTGGASSHCCTVPSRPAGCRRKRSSCITARTSGPPTSTS